MANLPLAKSLDTFQFAATPVNEALVRQWHEGVPVESFRNLILVGGTGTGKTHLAVVIASHLIKQGRRGRFFTVLDLVNRLETEQRANRWQRCANAPGCTSSCSTNWATSRSARAVPRSCST